MPSEELFYVDGDGKRQDADLHNPILVGGNSAKARASSKKLLDSLGLPSDFVDPTIDEAKLKRIRDKNKNRARLRRHFALFGPNRRRRQLMARQQAESLLQRGSPKTLYVCRSLLDSYDFIDWAKNVGFNTVMSPNQLHVTVAFSKQPIDWSKLTPERTSIVVNVVDGRSIERLGPDGAVVLRFASPELTQRWRQICDAGASWDFDDYKPHVTITFDAGDMPLDSIRPYQGQLLFGPEVFEEIDPSWKDNAVELEWDETKHSRVPAGSPDGGQFGYGGGGGSESVADDKPVTKVQNYKPGVYGSDNKSVDEFKRKWIAESPIKSVSTAVSLALPTQKRLDEIGKSIANEFDVKWKNPGPKTHDRNGNIKQGGIDRIEVKAKARADRGGISAVMDIARGTFIVDTPKQADAIIERMGEKVEVLAEEWRRSDVNYFDRTALLRFENGMVAEVQMMDPRMAAAKSPDFGGGHDLYAQWRSAPEGPKKQELYDAQVKLYGDVLNSYPPEWRSVVDRVSLKASLGSGGKSGK